MDFFSQLIQNKPLICAICGFGIAQILKVIIVLIENKTLDWTRLMGSGGMPSSHSAFATGLATSIGLEKGFQSAEFAIVFVLAFIVMYDASGVRRATGEQAKILNKMIKGNDAKGEFGLYKDLKELIGHTPFQVIVGALLGVAVALFIYKDILI